MVFTWDYNNGNTGDAIEYGTEQEAIAAADADWYHLTEREKAAYNRDKGGWFLVYEGTREQYDAGEGRDIRDYTETVWTVAWVDADFAQHRDRFDDYFAALGFGTAKWEALTEGMRMEIAEDDGVAFCLLEGRPYDDGADTVLRDWQGEMREEMEDELPDEVVCVKHVVASGNGLGVNITREVKLLGLGRGDAVELTIRRVD